MTNRAELPRPVPAFRLGVIGNRDLQDADRAVLSGTVTRFLEQLRQAIDAALTESRRAASPEPYVAESPRLFLVDSLAEGADQLVAEAATAGGFGYRVRCPTPFEPEEYKRLFTYDREESMAVFDRITQAPENDTAIVELARTQSGSRRSDEYAAAADVLLDNSDLLLAVYDPSRAGSEGGTADTVDKALAAGVRVVGINIRAPESLVLVTERSSAGGVAKALTPDALGDIVSDILLPPGFRGRSPGAQAGQDQAAGLRRYLREPLIAGSGLTRSLCLLLNGIYGAFWAIIPTVGSIGAALWPQGDRAPPEIYALRAPDHQEHARLIDEVQQPYRDRMAPVDALADFYMSLYRGSFVMNFVLGALAVLFGLLSYFNYANQSLWLRVEIVALTIILINFAASRVWSWHGRALDYRFIAEYLRQMLMLAPLGRSAPSIRPAAQYRGHDPTGTWMGWYVRALDRDQGLIEFQAEPVPRVLRMDEAFFETMRARLCGDWLLGQYQYYRQIERRFEGAITVIRALMLLLFVITAAGVVAHLMRLTVALDAASWRDGALLTIIIAAVPAFLGALHGIAVQGELEVTAERASDMSAHLASAITDMTRQTDSESSAVFQLSEQAVRAAHMMLGEVLDWRIIHQAHQVELT